MGDLDHVDCNLSSSLKVKCDAAALGLSIVTFYWRLLVTHGPTLLLCKI